jgi:sporulation protein YlmC with PRC-barrel domain
VFRPGRTGISPASVDGGEGQVQSIIGQQLLDRDGVAIGKVTDVIFDAATQIGRAHV